MGKRNPTACFSQTPSISTVFAPGLSVLPQTLSLQASPLRHFLFSYEHLFTSKLSSHLRICIFSLSLPLNFTPDSMWPAVSAHWANIPCEEAQADLLCTRLKCKRCGGIFVHWATRRAQQYGHIVRKLKVLPCTQPLMFYNSVMLMHRKWLLTWSTPAREPQVWISHMFRKKKKKIRNYISHDSPGIK